MSKIVIALGGNALGKNAQEQKEIVKKTAISVLDLFEQGNQIVIAHGNGPQVGMINNAFSESGIDMPFPECGAMSQGYIGYHIQNAIRNEASKRKLVVNPISLITQTIVDSDDPAFVNPTKPIGDFMTEEAARKLAAETSCSVSEDAGRGWRKVIASPKPLEIVENEIIKRLINVKENIVIAGGGGGIPVIEKDGTLIGVEAVIDKDATSSKIAETIGADIFMILTAVDKVFINYGQPNQEALDKISLKDLKILYEKNTFAEGSMKPKVKAVLDFVENTSGVGYIANLGSVDKVLEGLSGTKIIK